MVGGFDSSPSDWVVNKHKGDVVDININREVLINALRNGGYLFGKGNLREEQEVDFEVVDDVWCWGGVACELYRQSNPYTCRWDDSHDEYYLFICETDEYGIETKNAYPPIAVIDFFGISSSQCLELICLNDGYDGPDGLGRIADAIQSIRKEI